MNIQHRNKTHHFFFFTTRIQQKHVYKTRAIQHIIQHAYNRNTFIQHVDTTGKSKINWEDRIN